MLQPEAHRFKSVNGMTSTNACRPVWGSGCILRPAIFEDGQSRQAPFLLSLPFLLLYCRATLTLDPQCGLSMHLGRFNHRVPLHIVPTGALRVPLDKFTPSMLSDLRRAIHKIQSSTSSDLHHVCPEAGPSSSNLSAPADPDDFHHAPVGVSQQAQPLREGGEAESSRTRVASHGAAPSYGPGERFEAASRGPQRTPPTSSAAKRRE